MAKKYEFDSIGFPNFSRPNMQKRLDDDDPLKALKKSHEAEQETEETLIRFGEKGWCLVSVVHDGDWIWYYFQREVQDYSIQNPKPLFARWEQEVLKSLLWTLIVVGMLVAFFRFF